MVKLLFGVSDTNECRQAVKTIVKLFGHRDEVALTLLHVIPEVLVYPEGGIVNYTTTQDIEKQELHEILDEFENMFKIEGISCKKILRVGNPIDIVLGIVSDFDLLVIGASESSLLHRIFISHQNSFVNSSPIPVLVAK